MGDPTRLIFYHEYVYEIVIFGGYLLITISNPDANRTCTHVTAPVCSGCPTHRWLVAAPAVVFKMDIIPQRVIGIPLACALTQPMSQQLPSATPLRALCPLPSVRVPSYAAAAAAQASGPGCSQQQALVFHPQL